MGLRVLDVLIVLGQNLSDDLMSALLIIKCLSEVMELEIGVSDGLIALSNLDVVLTKEVDVSI